MKPYRTRVDPRTILVCPGRSMRDIGSTPIFCIMLCWAFTAITSLSEAKTSSPAPSATKRLVTSDLPEPKEKQKFATSQGELKLSS